MTAAFILISMALAFLFLGCVAVDHKPPVTWVPYPDRVREIERLPYVRGEFDCSNKAALLLDYYRREGLAAKMLIIWEGRRHMSRYQFAPVTTRITHAVVVVQHPTTGQWHEIDPTRERNIDGLPARREYLREIGPKRITRELAQANEYFEAILTGKVAD